MYCIDCIVELVLETNWSPSRAKKKEYRCKPCCASINKNNEQMRVNGKYVSKTHPLYKPGRYVIDGFFGECSLDDERIKEGYVYCISNPAFPGWIKVGKALSIDKRLSSYQTSSPHRDFKLEWAVLVDDRHEVEQEFHRGRKRKNSEWYQMGVGEAYTLVHSIPQVGVVDVQEDN